MAQQSVCAHCGFRNAATAHFCARCEEVLQEAVAPPRAPSRPAAGPPVDTSASTRVAGMPPERSASLPAPVSRVPTAPWSGGDVAPAQRAPFVDPSDRTEVSYTPQRRVPQQRPDETARRPAGHPQKQSSAAPQAASPVEPTQVAAGRVPAGAEVGRTPDARTPGATPLARAAPAPRAEPPQVAGGSPWAALAPAGRPAPQPVAAPEPELRSERTEVSYRPPARTPAPTRPPVQATAVLDEAALREGWHAPLDAVVPDDIARDARGPAPEPPVDRAPRGPAPRQAPQGPYPADAATRIGEVLLAPPAASPPRAPPADAGGRRGSGALQRLTTQVRKLWRRAGARAQAAATPDPGELRAVAHAPPAGRPRAALALAVDAAVVFGAMAAWTALEMAMLHGGWPSERATGLEAVAWWIYVYHRSVRRVLAAGLAVAGLQLALGVRTGKTPGRLVCGLALVGSGPEVRGAQGKQLSWANAAWHLVGGALCLLSGGAGVYWMVVDPRGRTWANLLSRTVVVRNRPGEAP